MVKISQIKICGMKNRIELRAINQQDTHSFYKLISISLHLCVHYHIRTVLSVQSVQSDCFDVVIFFGFLWLNDYKLTLLTILLKQSAPLLLIRFI